MLINKNTTLSNIIVLLSLINPLQLHLYTVVYYTEEIILSLNELMLFYVI